MKITLPPIDAAAIAALPECLQALTDCLQSLSRLPDSLDAYRVTCIQEAKSALLKSGATIEN